MSQLTLPVVAALTPPEYEVKIIDENVESLIERLAKSIIYFRSFYRITVFWQINVVYRRLFQVSAEES